MLMFSLPVENWCRLIVWLALGLVIYFSYGYKHSELQEAGRGSHRDRADGGADSSFVRPAPSRRQAGCCAPRVRRWPCCCSASAIVGGTIGYMVIEGWSAWDAFYMTVITVTTVGYREVHDLSRAGRGLHRPAAARRRRRGALHLHAAGDRGRRGRTSQAAPAETARDACSRPSTITSSSAGTAASAASSRASSSARRCRSSSSSAIRERMQAAMEDGALAVEADASREDVLKRVGIDRARGLIAAVGTDAENVYAVLSARVLRPDLFIVGRAETEDATIKLKRAGADRVISPYQIGAAQMAQTALRPAVVDFVELATGTDNLELSMEEVGDRRRLRAGGADAGRRQPPAAVRRHRRRHSAGQTGAWNSTRRPTARFTPATSSSCSAGRIRSNSSKWRPRRHECSRARRHRRRESDSE